MIKTIERDPLDEKIIQTRPKILNKKREIILNDYLNDWFNDLADWFIAEQQLREEINNITI